MTNAPLDDLVAKACPYAPTCIPTEYGRTCRESSYGQCSTFLTYLELTRKTRLWYALWDETQHSLEKPL